MAPPIDTAPLSVALEGPSPAELLTLPNIALGLAAGCVLYNVCLAAYRLWFHPLSKFPGPPGMAVSDIPYSYRAFVEGRMTEDMAKLHRKYGKVVRIGPNRLAFDSVIGFRDIYSHRPGGDAAEFGKVEAWFSPEDHYSILGAPGPDHRRHRRQLATAFSEGALAAQQPILMHYIDLFIRRISESAEGGAKDINILDWLNYITFDIIGDLALGESFGSLQGSDYHPWVSNIFRGIRGGSHLRFVSAMGPFVAPLALLDPGGLIKAMKNNRTYTFEKSLARIEMGPEPTATTKARLANASQLSGPRRDFFSYMLRHKGSEKDGLTIKEMLENSFILIIAGSETTATALSVLLYELSRPRHHAIRDILTAEIRAAFRSEAEVDLRSVDPKSLPYLHACIEEALRIHTPAAEIQPRISPGAMVDGEFVPKGTLVHIYNHVALTDPANFLEPESFLPQRFLSPDHPLYEPRFAAAHNMDAFKPFGTGPRNCIGKNLAYAEMRLIMARLLLRFDIDLGKKTGEDWLDDQRIFSIWEKPDLFLRMTERKDLELKA